MNGYMNIQNSIHMTDFNALKQYEKVSASSMGK